MVMILTCMDCLAIKSLAAIELTELVVVWQFVYSVTGVTLVKRPYAQ